MNAGPIIHIVGTKPEGQPDKAFWQHIAGLVLIQMRERGWTGGYIIDAIWKDGILDVQVGPGWKKFDVQALAEFIRAKKRRT